MNNFDNTSLENVLLDIEGPPRLLLYFLWGCQGLFYIPSRVKKISAVATNSSEEFERAKFNKGMVLDFITKSGSARFNMVLGVLNSQFKTFNDLGRREFLPTLLAWSLLQIPVQLNMFLDNGKTSVNSSVLEGLVTITQVPEDSNLVLLTIPWIFVYQVWKIMPVFKLFETPTQYLSPKDAENVDCGAMCLWLFAYSQYYLYNTREKTLPLSKLFPNIEWQIELPMSDQLIPPAVSSTKIDAKKFIKNYKNLREAKAVINSSQSPFADWFLYFPEANNVPLFLTYDWDQCTHTTEGGTAKLPLALFGQSKRYDKLAADIITAEYRKVQMILKYSF